MPEWKYMENQDKRRLVNLMNRSHISENSYRNGRGGPPWPPDEFCGRPIIFPQIWRLHSHGRGQHLDRRQAAPPLHQSILMALSPATQWVLCPFVMCFAIPLGDSLDIQYIILKSAIINTIRSRRNYHEMPQVWF